jgi:hypothetical protein
VNQEASHGVYSIFIFSFFSLFLFFLSSLVNLVDSRIGVDTFQQHMTILSKNDAMLTAKRREPSLAAPKLSAGGWVGGWVGWVGGCTTRPSGLSLTFFFSDETVGGFSLYDPDF